MHMTLVVGDNRQPFSRQPKQRSTSDAKKVLSRVYPKNNKGQLLVACSSNDIQTGSNTKRFDYIGEER